MRVVEDYCLPPREQTERRGNYSTGRLFDVPETRIFRMLRSQGATFGKTFIFKKTCRIGGFEVTAVMAAKNKVTGMNNLCQHFFAVLNAK
ncbi:MAG: hypothetical protein ACKVQW_11465 [Pyrinomonadaceae bacterium]